MPPDADVDPIPPRRGRRRGTNDTRQEVLKAASTCFAREGYAAATIRKIATEAGVDAALVMQFFGSKEGLFAAIMSIPPSVSTRLDTAFDGPDDGLGERVTRAYLELWEGDPTDSEPLLVMLRSAISNDQAAAQLREFVQARLLEGIGSRLQDDPTAALRAGLASTMLIGLVLGRRILEVPVLVAEHREAIVAIVSPAIQSVLVTSSAVEL